RRMKRRRALFYAAHGPASMIAAWKDDLRKQKYTEKLIPATIDLIVHHLNKEFRKVIKSKVLRLDTSKITAEEAADFNLQSITGRVRLLAPHLLSLLNGLAGVVGDPADNDQPTEEDQFTVEDQSMDEDQSTDEEDQSTDEGDQSMNEDLSTDEEDQSTDEEDQSTDEEDQSTDEEDQSVQEDRSTEEGHSSDDDIVADKDNAGASDSTKRNNDPVRKKKAPAKDPNAVVAAILSMLIFLRNRQANYFQLLMGLFLYSNGTARSVISVFNKACVAVSHQTILKANEALSNDSSAKAREVAITKPFVIVYDNINIAFRKGDQRIHNQDSFDNGTTATLIVSDVHAEVEALEAPCKRIRPKDMLPSFMQDCERRKAYCFHLIDVLQRRVKAFKDYTPMPLLIQPLPVKATVMYPLPLMHINQATVEGNKDILETIMDKELQIPEDWFEGRRILIAGDQLTTIRIHTLKRVRSDDTSAFQRHEYAVPIMQLFHLQMLLGATILRNHFGDLDTPGSLAYNAERVSRRRVTLDKPDFHATHELLCHSFDAVALRAWEVILKSEDLKNYELPSMEERLRSSYVRLQASFFLRKFIEEPKELPDASSKNAGLFIRDMLMYLELGSAIKAGDIGRLENVIKYITIFMQAGGTKNYANELLSMHVGFYHSWSAQTKRAVLSCVLVNPTGQKNRFIPTDLYQEHNNLKTKEVHGLRGQSSSWGSMGRAVSTNIRTFDLIGKEFQKAWGVTYTGTSHAIVSTTEDVDEILRSLKEYGVVCSKNGKGPNVKEVRDLLQEGSVKLVENNYLRKFVKRHLELPDAGSESDEMESDTNDEMDFQDDVDMAGLMDSRNDMEEFGDIEFDKDMYVEYYASLDINDK
ncbi:hypothetical protein EC968_008657, partial [Mortierella alpina]